MIDGFFDLKMLSPTDNPEYFFAVGFMKVIFPFLSQTVIASRIVLNILSRRFSDFKMAFSLDETERTIWVKIS